MGLQNVMNYGMRGRAIDAQTYGIFQGLPTTLGILRGLFTPDADGMSQVHDPKRTAGESKTTFGGFPMLEELFGTNSKGVHSNEFPTWLKYGALIAGASILLPVISQSALQSGLGPLPRSIYSTPFSPAGAIPLLWRRGYIQNWGLWAGLRLPGGIKLL